MSGNDLSKLLAEVQFRVGKTKGRRATRVIGMFDLSGSTPLKLRIGHTSGTRAALLHNLVCREIAKKSRGSVVKELGDGILIKFEDP